MTGLHYLDATTALGLFRRRELSPVELLEATIGRIEEVNGGINALTETLFEEALPAARKAANQYARGRDLTPLLGLPVAAKEKHGIQGRTLSQGLVARKDSVAAADHPVTARIRSAGGIIHARTTTPELSCATVTHSPLWGVTRNPWNPKFSPAGRPGFRGGVGCRIRAAGKRVRHRRINAVAGIVHGDGGLQGAVRKDPGAGPVVSGPLPW